MTSTWIVTLEDEALAALKAIENVALVEVQQDVVPGLIAFLQNAADTTISKLGSFLKGLVSDIVGTSTSAAPVEPAALTDDVSPAA